MSNYFDSHKDCSLNHTRIEQEDRNNSRRFVHRKAKLKLNLNQNDKKSQQLMRSNHRQAIQMDINENDDISILQDEDYDLQDYPFSDNPTRILTEQFSSERRVNQKRKAQIHDFYLSTLKQIIEHDGTMSLRQIRKALIDRIDQERRYNRIIPKISVSKIVKILHQAGYQQKKLAHNSKTNLKENIARREEFCRYLKNLIENKIPIYFYHETDLGKSHNVVVIRCLLSPNGIACWQVTLQNKNKRQKLQQLINKLQRSDSRYDKVGRKFLMMDKRAINNQDQFCETVQLNEFDIISMPFGSIDLNPINRFFKRMNNDLRNEYYSSKEELFKKCEYILLSYNSNSLGSYLQHFHRDIQNGLPYD